MAKILLSLLKALWKASVYIRVYSKKFLIWLKPKIKIALKFIKRYKDEFIIGGAAIPVALIWGLLLYRWYTTPRPAGLHTLDKSNAYYFEGTSNLYDVKIGDRKTNNPKVEFSLIKSKDKSVTFYPASPDINIPTPFIKDNTITFNNVYQNTNYTYKPLTNGVEETITVNKANGISTYPFFLEMRGIVPQYYTSNIAGGIFYDANKKYLFNFQKPYAVDAKGIHTDNVDITIQKDTVTGKLVAILNIDKNWLNDTSRVYPITIDPTIVYNSSSAIASGILNRVTDSQEAFATGGTVTYSNGYEIHTFTSSGTLTVNGTGNIQALVVAGGGGGGGGSYAAGGGAGGVTYDQSHAVTPQTYAITVGGGGAGGSATTRGSAGGNSVFDTITTNGGGSGGTYIGSDVNGSTGGSGGGGSSNTGEGGAQTQSNSGGGIGYGYAGGTGTASGGAGGGGALGPGANGISGNAAGGPGISSSISGSAVTYATGGTGSVAVANGVVGAANTGNGGAGGGLSTAGGTGGSGIVIISFPISYSSTTSNLSDYYQELPADQFTVGLWHMDEASVTDNCSDTKDVCDSSGNSNNGTVNGTSLVPGIVGNARNLNGTSDYINVNNATSINFGQTSPFTIEGWFYPTGVNGTIINKQENTTNEFAFTLAYNSSSQFVFSVSKQNVSGNSITSTSYSINQWYHVAGVSDGTNLYLYVNGILQGSTAMSFSSATTSVATLYMGETYNSTSFFNGSLDEIRISNIDRTQEEITMDAQRRPYGIYTSPVIDLTKASAWNSLTWTTSGLKTGSGETIVPSATGNLVAQWNFNDTPPTATAVSAGTCGTSCNGTLNNFAAATGGTVTYTATSQVYSFTSSGLFIPNITGSVQILVVGGGGGANGGVASVVYGDGGGGGTVYSGSYSVTAGVPIPVTVGAGGIAVNTGTGGQGGSSTFGTITVTGGTGTINTSHTGGANTNYSGGTGSGTDSGGGAGGGNNAVAYTPGDGYLSSITGTPTYYAGGGAGVHSNGYLSGGQGGGGASAATGVAGTPNTGGGGGGGGTGHANGNGGSGIVIVAYSTSSLPVMTVHTFTSSGTFTPNFTGNVEALVVGGGGGGNGGVSSVNYGDGGGGGTVTVNSIAVTAGVPVSVTVGGGGGGVITGTGGQGGSSIFSSITSTGGTGTINTSKTGGANANYSGGTGSSGTDSGGGAGGGNNGNAYTPGDGALVFITGSSVNYAGGGGGIHSAVGQSGGLGGGGAGNAGGVGVSGTANTGGGGGGGGTSTGGGNGGSGIVIIAYPSSNFGTNNGYDATLPVSAGWTQNNARWPASGPKALMFNGTSNYVSVTHNSAIDFNQGNAFSVEAWVKTTASNTSMAIIDKQENVTNELAYVLGTNASNQFYFALSKQNVSASTATASQTYTTGQWYHLVGVTNGTNIYIYVNGILQGSTTVGFSNATQDVATLYMGEVYNGTGFFNGVMDSTRIYSRALTAPEILSNYNNGNIELQTRVGNSTNSDDATWDAWAPTANETQIDSFDADSAHWAWDSSTASTNIPTTKSDDTTVKVEGTGSMKNILGQPQVDGNTVALWHLDETGGSGAYITDSANAHNGTPFGTSLATGISRKARSFNGIGDYVTVPDSSSLTPATITVSAWVKPSASITSIETIVDKRDNAYGTAGYNLELYNNSGTYQIIWQSASSSLTVNYTLPVNQWTYLAVTQTGTTAYLYVNGSNVGVSTSITALTNFATPLLMGKRSDGYYFAGTIDEVRIDNIFRSGEWVAESYRLAGNHYLNDTSISTTDLHLKNSLPFFVAADRPGNYVSAIIGNTAFANYQSDTNTVGLWHMDDQTPNVASGGTITTSGGNTIHTFTTSGTFTPTFAGDIRVLVVGGGGAGGAGANNGHGAGGGGAGAFVENDALAITATPYTVTVGPSVAGNTTTNGANGNPSSFDVLITAAGGGGGGGSNDANSNIAGSNGASGGGGKSFSGAGGTATAGFHGGAGGPSTNGNGGGGGGGAGAIGADALAADRKGGQGGAGLTSSLSGASVQYAGGGGGGTYSSGTAGSGVYGGGNGSHTGNGSDATPNTGGGGGGGSGAATSAGGAGASGIVIVSYSSSSVQDASGNGNTGALNGTTFVQGKIGMARSFNGTSDYINAGNSINIANSSYTLSAWVRKTATGAYQGVIGQGPLSNGAGLQFGFTNTDTIMCRTYGGGTYDLDSTISVTDTNWHYINCSFDVNSKQKTIYLDGVIVAQATAANYTGTGQLNIGSTYSTPSNFFTGTIDEVRIDNIVRTSTDIRQAFEVGLRTHQITIDFAANLSTANLITSKYDTLFTVDATAYGLPQMGSNLYPGDKIIVRENYNGTEYIAQATVNSVNAASGAVSVDAWDTGSTFPPYGFDGYADVFKWQREFFDILNRTTQPAVDINQVAILTLRVTNGDEGRTVWLDDLKSESGYLDTSGTDTIASLTGKRYFQYRAIIQTTDYNVSPSLTGVTLNYTQNTPPATPLLDSPSNTSTQQSLTPTLETHTTDADGDTINYRIIICTNATMTIGCTTLDQASNGSGWDNGSTPYSSGTHAHYTFPSPLAYATTYYWESLAKDPTGTNTFSATQSTPYSFTTVVQPTAPTGLQVGGSQNPMNVTNQNPNFTAICNHPISGYVMNQYEVQISFDRTFASPFWDSTQLSMASCTQGSRSANLPYSGTALALDGKTYYWRVRFWDTAGTAGAWSTEYAFFDMNPTYDGTPTGCAIKEATNETSLTLLWNDMSNWEDHFRIEESLNGAAFSFLANSAANTTSYPSISVSAGNTYAFRIRAENALATQVSGYCTTDTVNLSTGTFQLKGVQLNGVKLY